jgi:hypothetical protein
LIGTIPDAVASPMAPGPIKGSEEHSRALRPKMWGLMMRMGSIDYRNTLSMNP